MAIAGDRHSLFHADICALLAAPIRSANTAAWLTTGSPSKVGGRASVSDSSHKGTIATAAAIGRQLLTHPGAYTANRTGASGDNDGKSIEKQVSIYEALFAMLTLPCPRVFLVGNVSAASFN